MSQPIQRTFTLGTRPSKLALWQTEHILGLLKTAWPGVDFRIITRMTEGDKTLDRPLPEIGGKGVFTAELETALRSGEIDLAVHSLKDLPVLNTPGLCIGAISQRGDARDVLVSANREALTELPHGARVGTSSLRRQAQLKARRPDLTILPVRGNVDTRIRKALQGAVEAIVLAAAGVERLSLGQHVAEVLSLEVMLPAPGQGALAVQCRAQDDELLQLLRPVHDLPTDRAVTAERAFLAELGAGCSAPVAAFARCRGTHLEIDGLVASPDGQRVIRISATGDDPITLGSLMARQAMDQGAGDLLK